MLFCQRVIHKFTTMMPVACSFRLASPPLLSTISVSALTHGIRIIEGQHGVSLLLSVTDNAIRK